MVVYTDYQCHIFGMLGLLDKAGLGFALLVVVYANTCISER